MQPIDFFLRTAKRHGQRIAIDAPSGGITYADLLTQVNALACALQTIDDIPGSFVGLCAENSANYITAMLAIMAAGKVWVPLNYRSTKPEITRILNTIKPSIVMHDSKGQPLIDASIGEQIPFSEIPGLQQQYIGRQPIRHWLSGEAAQAIKFTGGTTGLPKGVVQPQRAWMAAIINQIHQWRITQDDGFVICAPLSHGTGTYVLPLLAQGARLVLCESNDAQSIMEAFARRGGSITFMPPTLIYKLMADTQATPSDFSNMRLLIYGGAPMPVEKIRQAQDYFGPVIATTYGQTEAPQIAAVLQPEEMMQEDLRSSVGCATWLTDIAILSADGQLLPTGDIGEVAIRGDLVMTGYWQLPEKTAETIRDGWLRTGDAGYLDARGYLFLKERLRDVIITGGFNVYPVDVENVLSQHPEIHEACVFGLPDDKWGESVNAAIELKPGSHLSEEEIKAFVRARLGPVMTPKHIHVQDTLPRSSVGKVLKTVIRTQYLATQSLTVTDAE